MTTITEKEIRGVSSLFQTAFQHVAQAFSQMSGEEIQITGFSLDFSKKKKWSSLLHDTITENFSLLLTEIKGEYPGKSYLLIEDSESKKILKIFDKEHPVSFPLSDYHNSILLELDNILSAALVTKLADLLKVRLYGDVPGIINIDPEDVKDMSLDLDKNFESVFHISAQFKSNSSFINITFICLFEPEFLKMLQAFERKKAS